jgi:hypothetical protein
MVLELLIFIVAPPSVLHAPADIVPNFIMPVVSIVWTCTGVKEVIPPRSNRKSKRRCSRPDAVPHT